MSAGQNLNNHPTPNQVGGNGVNSDPLVLSFAALLKSIRLLAYSAIVLSVLALAAGAMAFKLWKYQPKPRMIGLTVDGRAVPLHEIEGELYKPSNIIAWSEKKAESLYTFTFRSAIAEWPNELSEFLSQKTKSDWLKSIKDIESEVITKRAILYAQKDGKAQLIKSEFDKAAGLVVNVVEIPLTVVLDTGSTSSEHGRQFKTILRLYIGQVGFDNAPDGLKIGKIELVNAR